MLTPTYQTIQRELTGAVAVVTLSRPERRNAMSHLMVEELLNCFQELAGEPHSGVRVVILQAAGKVFCAGGDLADLAGSQSPEESRTAVARLDELLTCVNQAPQTRNIIVEWEATLPSQQDRWLPQEIIVNQGDTINLLVEDNDTDGAHTWTIEAPTGPAGALQLTQVNTSSIGQWKYFPPQESGPMFGTEVTGHPIGCVTMNQNVTCNTVGGCSINGGPLGPCTGSWMLNSTQTEIASIHATVTLGPLTVPGIYKYFCYYHQNIGMVGYLVVLPNKGYTANPTA